MTSQIIPVAPFDFIIFGGTGDLSERKLLPALYHRQRDHQFSEPTRIIGASRSKLSDDEFRAFARKAITDFVKAEYIDKAELEKFLSRLSYVPVDAKSGEGFAKLKKALGDTDTIRVFYLAVAPGIFGDISHKLKEHKLVTANSRIVVEKPIGRDLESATQLNDMIGDDFGEHQIFRIDHYLGKETVQNLMALRFANALYEPLWNYAHVDHVQITVAETVGLEDRITYYDKAGALRDMVQNHILQLLCLVAMEAPSSIDANAVRDEKLKVLNSLKRINGMEAPKSTVRGQYRAGASAGGAVKGYIEELGSNTGSSTETFVAIKAEIANWRWAGVPFYLRTGKRLAARVSEIVIEFKPIPHSIFTEYAGPIQANQLVIRLQPDEGVKQFIMIKDPGPGGMRLRQIPLDMSFAQSFDGRAPDAYERLIMDVVRGNQTLFMRRDEVEAAWRWVDPILSAWEDGRQEAQGYTSGNLGAISLDRAHRARRAHLAREHLTTVAGNWHKFASRDELARTLAADIAATLSQAIGAKGNAFLAVSGGTTPAKLFRELSNAPLDWKNVIVMLVDERFVPETSDRSNAALVRADLLQNRAREARFVGLYESADTVEAAAEQVSCRLAGLPWPLDIAILGMGTDGHTASFFPDAVNLDQLLSPGEAGYVLPVHALSAGERRLTLPLSRIVAAGKVVVHIEGIEKKTVLEAAIEPGANRPISAVFREEKKPIEIYWAP